MKEHVDGSVHDAVSGDLDLLIIGAGASGVGCGVMAGMFGVDPSKTLIVERGGAVLDAVLEPPQGEQCGSSVGDGADEVRLVL